MKYANKIVYEGEWKANKRHGKGMLKFPNGATYEGDFFCWSTAWTWNMDFVDILILQRRLEKWHDRRLRNAVCA